MSNRLMLNEIHNIFTVIRQLVSDNRVLHDSIDSAYEEVLLSDLRLIPEQYDQDIMNIINSVKIILSNINYSAISQGINDLMGGILHFNVNTYEEFKAGFSKINMTNKDKIRIMNIVSKFRPLFTCIDTMLADPIVYIRKAAQLSNNDYNDIF